jgi:hypothetical protein
MSDRALLVRASLDIRGVRPAVEEYQRLEADPEAFDQLVDEYLHDPRFPSRVADLWGEIYLTQTEFYTVNVYDYGIDATEAEFIQSIGAEPLQMVGHVAENDLPWTELVTADWTMANELLGEIWPIDRPDGPGWQRSTYNDGRPAAGVLSTNSMWWRYVSTASNANRKRANQISRILLCDDYLTRPIDFDRNINLLDQEAVDDAIKNNESCVSCHVSLDPLAGYLFGFWAYNYNSVVDMSFYHPERELRWQDYSGVAPGYYGEPGYTLEDLGDQIAADNTMAQCAVQQAWELLLRRDKTLDDTDQLTANREDFLDAGLTVRALFRSVIASPQYRAGVTDEPGYVPTKMVTPALLHSQITDLTGFKLVHEGFDALASDSRGYLTLAGGADGYFVTSHARNPNATMLMVHERLAEGAASHVVTTALDGEPSLLGAIDFTETPDTDGDAMAQQIVDLHFALHGNRVDLDGEEVTSNLELWKQIYEVERDIPMAWTGLISALLRDPDLLFY